MSFHQPQIQIQIMGTAVLQPSTLTSLVRPEHLEVGRPELVQMVKLLETPGQTLKLQFPPLILLARIQTLTFPKHL